LLLVTPRLGDDFVEDDSGEYRQNLDNTNSFCDPVHEVDYWAGPGWLVTKERLSITLILDLG
jgi:hypothetical protein